MTKLIEYLCIAYLTGSCFTALGIWLGLRSIAGAIMRKRFYIQHDLSQHKIVLEKAKDGSEFKIRID